MLSYVTYIHSVKSSNKWLDINFAELLYVLRHYIGLNNYRKTIARSKTNKRDKDKNIMNVNTTDELKSIQIYVGHH